MKRYRIVDQGSWYNPNGVKVFTIYVKKWWGWRHIREWFDTAEDAENILRKRHIHKGHYPVIKEVVYE